MGTESTASLRPSGHGRRVTLSGCEASCMRSGRWKSLTFEEESFASDVGDGVKIAITSIREGLGGAGKEKRGERRGGKTKATRPRGSGVREGAGASSGLAAEKGTDCCPPGWWRPAVTSGHRGGDRETEGELLEAAKGGKEGRKEIQDSRRFPGTRRLLPEAPVTPSTADNSPAPQPLLGKGPAVWHSEG